VSTLPTIEYDLNKLRQDLCELMMQLSDKRQKEISWIETAYIRVTYQDNSIIDEVKESTKQLSCALCVLYFVVVIESYFPSTYEDANGVRHNLWDEALAYGWIHSNEINILRAYKHVRHSFAHDSDGKHANQNRGTFDSVMSGNHPLPCIQSDGNKIVVSSGAAILMVNEVHAIIANILSRMLSSPQYGPKQPQ